MNLTQHEYNISCFLCQAIYTDIELPISYEEKHSIRKLSGLRADIFKFKDVDYIVICGTNGIVDWFSNLKIGLGITPKQFNQMLKFVVGEMNCNKRTIVCGHSLAGGITQYIVNSIKHNNCVGVTFNTVGIKHFTKERYEENIYNFITTKDVLSRISRIVPGKYLKNLGENHYIIDFDSINMIKSHSNWKLIMDYKLERKR